MKLRPLGKSDLNISPILMGTWQAGKEMWVGIDDAQTTSAIRAAFEAGITTFDTAEAYGNGHSERILGAAVSNFRDSVILATKVFANHLKSRTGDRSLPPIPEKFKNRRDRPLPDSLACRVLQDQSGSH